eukprot:TRINITY_DN1550_c0_g2_i1.p3 TRINITY_DN1550_c0_g2~~TRINITY_DN1550_c0_g2_i1.p3  ORF type:complete len:136 (+),score=10.30 TRINITY_DN1550_c0_g2_i1:48-455(+)
MSGPPPPPPPGPPPPPAVKAAAPPTESRGGLLSSIEGFKKGGLKKAVTNDRSAPITDEKAAAKAPPMGGMGMGMPHQEALENLLPQELLHQHQLDPLDLVVFLLVECQNFVLKTPEVHPLQLPACQEWRDRHLLQ